jgi:cytochrome oxidase Cu insertion factor (SCO1/SenC/PrrC family)
MFKRVRAWLIVFFLLGGIAGAQQVLPRPHTPSAVGKLAPDFTLRNEHGRVFHLASMRGQRLLLIFYRGYW